MADFYRVHCTNCGTVLGADRMAVDLDRIMKTHLSKVADRSSSQMLLSARQVFQEIRVGMYLTKFELVRDGVLEENGTLRLTCQYVLDFIGQRYQVRLNDIGEKRESRKEPETEEFSFDEFDALEDDDADIWEDEEEAYEIPPEILDELCFKMLLYAQVDNAEEVKRACIRDMLQLLLSHREELLLECHCAFSVGTDDKGQEFLSGLKVTYRDAETIAYNHMVCPHCGEAFFIDAGKYREHVIVMLGSSRVGKTAYLAAIVDAINPEYGQSRYPMITIKDTTDRKYTYFREHILKQYRDGKKIDKTPEQEEAVALFSLDVMIGERMMILTFVDLPGEVFVPRSAEEKEEGEASGRFIINHRKICYSADAFWFCIDPRQIDQRLHRQNEGSGGDRVEQDMETVFSNIGNALHIMGGAKADVPTGVIITKSDLITEEARLYFRDREFEPDCLLPDGKFLSDRFGAVAVNVARYLSSGNVKNILPKLQNMFTHLNYFAVAAYGVEVPEGTEGCDKAPSGVILPFLWTLSVLGYLMPVKYVQRIEKRGIIRKTEQVIEYYDVAEPQELFA